MDQATLALNFLASPEQGTHLRVQRQDPPWRAVRAFQNQSGESLVHLHNVSGGVLGGDHLHLEVHLHPYAQAQLTTTGATRIYRQKSDQRCSRQNTIVHIAREAVLEYLPDPIIPYAGAYFRQNTEFHLAQGSGLIAWETISAGRTAHGESFAFDELAFTTTIATPQRLLALERFALHPKTRNTRSTARFGRFEHAATMWVCRIDEHHARWPTLEAELNALAQDLSTPAVMWGASTLIQNGVVIRGLACEAYLISKGLEQFWRTAKHSVWNRPAIIPRKVS